MRLNKSSMLRIRTIALIIVFLSGNFLSGGKLFSYFAPTTTLADSTAQALTFSQNWTTTTLISTDDNWSGVPGIVGYRGDEITASTGVDPQTLVGEGTITVDVNANRADPNTFTTGGVSEFDGIANPTIALQGSGTADAPNIVINIITTLKSSITVAYNLRDIDGSTDNAVQPVALQFRVGSSGNFTNVPAGFVADATEGPSLATLVTAVSAPLPAAANNQSLVQVRIITSNAAASDEWVGIDDITITGSGVTDIDFVSGKANHYLKANNTNGETLVQWQTGMEVANLGFYVYREEGGKLTRVTPDLIAGSAIFAGANTILRAGRNYAWRDPQPLSTDTRYFIEEVDLNGLTQMYGPIYADSSNPIKQFSAEDREPSMLMSEMNQSTNSASENYQSPQLETTARMAKLTPARIEVQAAVNAKMTAKLSVNKEGWYRITQPELVAAGFNLNPGRRFLQLFVDGQEVPMKVTGDRDGRFAETDAIEFYGVGLDTPFSNSRAYFLVADSQPGRRVTEVTGSPGNSSPTSFPYTVERRDRTIYFSSLKNGAKENFLAQSLPAIRLTKPST